MMMRMMGLRRPFVNLGRRGYKVLAIESSCDDSCVALLDRHSKTCLPDLIDHFKASLDSTARGGIVPVEAFKHHQENLANLVKEMCEKHNLFSNPPDLICVTRGPGITGSLSIGIDIAKGLSVAWNKPLIGVHHMLGHLLVPRLSSNGLEPSFPFLSLLVSGGHTMLVRSTSLLEHEVLCDTLDIAAGDLMDKCARLLGFRGNMIAKEMDLFIMANEGKISSSPELDLSAISIPLQNEPGRKDMCAFSFAAFNGMVKRSLEKNNLIVEDMDLQTRYTISSKIQDTIFDHIIEKIRLTLRMHPQIPSNQGRLVLSGGVSANLKLRSKLAEQLPGFQIYYPELSFCTDNAVMIGWAGIELYEKLGYTSGLSFAPLRKWPMDELVDLTSNSNST